jgi:HEPN domain-containing protein
MSHHAVNLLRDRSLRMLNSAKRNLFSGDYNMAIFMADQSLQLYLKLVILELTGEIPRKHILRHLFNALRAILTQPSDIDQL